MEYIGRVTVLQPGIFVNGQLVEVGHVEEFLDSQTLGIGENKILLDPNYLTGNSIKLTLTAVPHFRAHPIGHELELAAGFQFGEEPGSAIVELGQPGDESASVEFLGHPDRDVILNLLELQEGRYDPCTMASFSTPALKDNPEGGRRQIIMTSPAIQTCFDKNPGQVMFNLIAYRGDNRDPLVDLNLAYLNDQDQLLRVYRPDSKIFYADLSDSGQRALEHAAEVIVFFRHYSNRFQELGLESISSYFLTHLASYISGKFGAHRPPFEAIARVAFFKDFLGFDWMTVRDGLKTDEVKQEKDRLQGVLLGDNDIPIPFSRN